MSEIKTKRIISNTYYEKWIYTGVSKAITYEDNIIIFFKVLRNKPNQKFNEE